MGQLGITPDWLSPSQLAFAHQNGAHPGLTSGSVNGAVFFYREDENHVLRWLVDREGQVLDYARFPKR